MRMMTWAFDLHQRRLPNFEVIVDHELENIEFATERALISIVFQVTFQ
jgi:hypothetical protein